MRLFTAYSKRRLRAGGRVAPTTGAGVGAPLAGNAARRLPRGLLVGRSLVEFALRYCQVLIELAKPRQIAGGQLQHARGRDQSGLGLQEIGVCRW